jgi:hypothetical protein
MGRRGGAAFFVGGSRWLKAKDAGRGRLERNGVKIKLIAVASQLRYQFFLSHGGATRNAVRAPPASAGGRCDAAPVRRANARRPDGAAGSALREAERGCARLRRAHGCCHAEGGATRPPPRRGGGRHD